MRTIRINTALALLLSGVLLMAAEFAMLNRPSLSHPGVAGTVLTFAGTEGSGTAGCHEESAPKNQAPHNHDCCTGGHLHAIGSAQVSIVRPFVVTSADNSFIPSASLDQTASPARQTSDSGPPGSAVPIRV